jgi:para-nitrobenzyl esterase
MLHARYAQAPAYIYYFDHQPAAPLKPCKYGCGAGHGAEIRFMFDNLDQDRRAWSVADRQVAAQMADAWVNFARTGDPNFSGVPGWPKYRGSHATILHIGRPQADLPDLSVFARH